jgi:hypothetical protein
VGKYQVLIFLEANPAFRYNLFRKCLFLQATKGASAGRTFVTAKNSHSLKKDFHFNLG